MKQLIPYNIKRKSNNFKLKHDITQGVKGLIFDLDGTLADTMPFHYKGWKEACLKYGAGVQDDFLYNHTGSPSLTIAAELIKTFRLEGKVTKEQLLDDKISEFYKLQHLVKPIKTVTDIVKAYFGKLPMAIGTGGHKEAVDRTLKITGLRKYFDIIVTANDIERYKPDPETFLKCAELMKVDPAVIEVFEDTEQGLEAARKAGMVATDVRSWYESER